MSNFEEGVGLGHVLKEILIEIQNLLNVKKEKETDKTNKDWQLHLHDKYTLGDCITGKITLIHPYEYLVGKECLINLNGKEIYKHIKFSIIDIDTVKSLLESNSIKYTIVDNTNSKEIERINDISKIE